MSAEQNKTVVRRLFEEAVDQANLAVLDELLAPDIVVYTQVPGVTPGREGFRQFLQLFLGAFPVQHTEIHELLAEGNKVVCRHTHHVVHGGDFMGIPPTGHEAHVQGIEIFHVVNGQVAEMWHQDDLLSLMQQLGAIPVPAS